MTLHGRFWEFPAAGFFLLWGLQLDKEKYPRSSITCFAPDNEPLCGFVPNACDGTSYGFWANDKCGL